MATALADRVARLTRRILSLLLAAYPAGFRTRFGAELLETAHRDLELASAAGAFAAVRAGAHAVTDSLAGLVPEHWNAWRRAGHRPASLVGGLLREDARQAVRQLLSARTYTSVALVVLALGIGAATVVFTVVDAVVLRGLPIDRADRVMTVVETNPARPADDIAVTTAQTYLDWRARQQSFTALAATASSGAPTLTNENGEPATARLQSVTWEFFPVLRITPILGRAFAAGDEIEGARPVAILGHGLWLRLFGGARDVVGRTITLDGQRWDIVGVMPKGFAYPIGRSYAAEIYTPIVFKTRDRVRAAGRTRKYAVIGRLDDGVSPAQAAGDMNRVAEALDAEYPAWSPGSRIRLLTLHEQLVGDVRSWMLMLLGAVGLVLLIACANVANLMLARATVRGREMGLRAALGASRWRLVRGLLVEGVMLSLAGTAIGVLLAYATLGVVKGWLPAGVPRAEEITMDLRVLFAAIAAALVTGILFALVPAIPSSRPDLTGALNEGGRSATPGVTGQRWRNILVVAEIALAVILLVGAGLFVGSFVKLMRIDPGFDYRRVLVVDVEVRFSPASYREALLRGAPYTQQVLDAVRQVPGIESAGAISGGLPLSGSWVRSPVTLPGRGPLTGPDDDVDTRSVSPGYLETLRIPLFSGRYVNDEDRDGAPLVVVVNEAAAQKYWPGQEPIGQQITIEKKSMTVVGVVGNVRQIGPEVPSRQEAYIPMPQSQILGAAIVMRTDGEPLARLPSVKAAIWSVNKEQRIFGDTFTLAGYLDTLIAQRRFNMALLALFGMLGLVIAAVGLYGVMAYVVAQRTNEIGIRMALGATGRDVVMMVLIRSGVLITAGLAIGAIAARILSAGVSSFLFQVQPNDGRIFVAALATLAAAGLAASAIPARRASRVDPLVALRRN